ncbi:MAG: hypothetical protein IPH82_10165 [Chloroflexi bacterium]|nr:hypothetical protein [Chloroflexota bacterium]
MTTGSILLGLALILLVGLFIAQPLLLPEEKKARSRSPRQKLLAQKAALLEEVRALDFDYDTGKIPQKFMNRSARNWWRQRRKFCRRWKV